MNIKINQVNGVLTVILEGRIDSTTAPTFGTTLDDNYVQGNIKQVIIDCAKLDYISSAGLRVLLANQKRVNADKAGMKLINVNDAVMDVFNITGFVDILNIEKGVTND